MMFECAEGACAGKRRYFQNIISAWMCLLKGFADSLIESRQMPIYYAVESLSASLNGKWIHFVISIFTYLWDVNTFIRANRISKDDACIRVNISLFKYE